MSGGSHPDEVVAQGADAIFRMGYDHAIKQVREMIDEEISAYGFGGEVDDSDSYHALMALRARFEEVVG